MKYEVYKNLSKEEKNKVKLQFKATKRGDDLIRRFNRLIFFSIIYLLIAVIICVYGLINDTLMWYDWLVIVCLLICSIIFMVGQHNLRLQQYCRFIKIGEKVHDMKNKREADKKKD